MITSAEEYYASLFAITANGNKPELIPILPSTETIYNIDLNSRTVETPEFLSVQYDHTSETIYFMCDRFHDNMDLSETTCIIQYINANNEGRYYVVPYYDVYTYRDSNKMLIPWCIEGEATKAAGNVSYSFRFFKTNSTNTAIIYNLNTAVATSKVLIGMNVKGYYPVQITADDLRVESETYYYKDENGNYVPNNGKPFSYDVQYYALSDGKYSFETDTLDAIYNRLNKLEGKYTLYWTDV